jgi:ribosome-associated protein
MAAPLIRDLISEIEFQVQRSRGPGGQNVNRTNSSVQLRWDYNSSSYLSDEQKQRITLKMQKWMNKEGTVLIRSDVHRDQDQNKREVLTRLQKILVEAFHQAKKRKATRPTLGSKIRKQKTKQIRSDVKKGRQTKWD